MNDVFKDIKYFKSEEFDSPDEVGSGKNMNPEFLKMLDCIREKAGFPLKVTSGYRTVKHNDLVGGKGDSAHTKGIAVDISINGSRERHDLVRSAIECGINRIGIGTTFCHLDMDFDKDQRVIWLYP